jgi:hypothetical protein
LFFVLFFCKTCGKVEKWDRAADRFGYCDFDDAPAVVCAVRVLNNLEIGESTLLVKIAQKTKAYVAEYFQRKLLTPGSLPDAGEDAKLSQEDREERARAALEKIVSTIAHRASSTMGGALKKPDLLACEALLQSERRRQVCLVVGGFLLCGACVCGLVLGCLGCCVCVCFFSPHEGLLASSSSSSSSSSSLSVSLKLANLSLFDIVFFFFFLLVLVGCRRSHAHPPAPCRSGSS